MKPSKGAFRNFSNFEHERDFTEPKRNFCALIQLLHVGQITSLITVLQQLTPKDWWEGKKKQSCWLQPILTYIRPLNFEAIWINTLMYKDHKSQGNLRAH